MQTPNTEEHRLLSARFAYSALAAILILCAGMGWSWRVGLRANDLDHRLDHLQHPLMIDHDHHEEAHQ